MKKSIVSITLAFILCITVIPAHATGAAPNPSAPVNLAPIAENLELTTYRGVSVSGRLMAIDPENDPLTFEIVTIPRKGSIELGEGGSFVYTPAEGKKGRDYFGYKARDVRGNYSQEATAIIKIEKQKTTVSYSDLRGNGGEYAALRLVEEGIFTGACLSGSYLFSPEQTVSRGEFLAMCIKTADIHVLSGVTRTGWSNDENIPMWVKPYITTAMLSGIISPHGEGSLAPVFDVNEPISIAEAAVILNRTLRITDVAAVSVQASDIAPVWARQALANLVACQIITGPMGAYDSCLTREDAAAMLMGAARLLENR